ncbi:MAG TPA: glycosyltransferase family 2 protein [Actinomycetota bacterium]|nr:glycosyltransferase family 2 protein [Actinomycetota bacterium]
MSVHRLTIAVPVYNESERVGPALKELLSTSFPVEVEILIVDDGSVDGTAETIAALPLPENVRLIKHERNRGKGAALRTALAEATGDLFVPFDADLEYQASDLVACLEPLIAGEAELVYGTRAFGSHTSFNFWYVMGNKFLNLWANILFNCYISDLETCFKMAKTSILRSLDLKTSGFDIEAEMTAKLLRAGYRPFEVPIGYKARSREQGKKISWKDGIIALWTIARIRFAG